MEFWTRDARPTAKTAYNHFSDDPEGTFWQKWLGGIIIPAMCLWVGLQGFLAADLRMGLLFAGMGVFAHAHYFLSCTRHYILKDLGKIAGLLGIISGLGYALHTFAVT